MLQMRSPKSGQNNRALNIYSSTTTEQPSQLADEHSGAFSSLRGTYSPLELADTKTQS